MNEIKPHIDMLQIGRIGNRNLSIRKVAVKIINIESVANFEVKKILIIE